MGIKGTCKYVNCEGCMPRTCPGTNFCHVYKLAARTENYQRHLEEDRARSRAYWKEHRTEETMQEKREWAKQDRKAHPEKYEAYRRNPENVIRASLKNHERRGLKVKVTVEEALEVYRATPHCKYCGREMAPAKGIQETSLSIDRINNEPVLRKDNIQFICHQCNMTKGNRTHEEFVAYMRNVLVILGNQ